MAIKYGEGNATDSELAAAADAAYAAYAAYAAAAACADSRKSNRQKTADICREILTEEVFKFINK